MKRFKSYLEEKNFLSFFKNLARKYTRKTISALIAIVSSGTSLNGMTTEKLEKVAKKLGIELEANEIHHVMHVIEEIIEVFGHTAEQLIHLVASNELEGDLLLEAGRPRLVKFQLKKNHVKWSCKNLETGKIYYLKLDMYRPEQNINAFLHNIKAVDEYSYPRTNELHNYNGMIKEIKMNGKTTFWVPENRVNLIKTTWSYDEPMKTKHDYDMTS